MLLLFLLFCLISFTIIQIEKVNKPTLVLAHNKTLAWQLYAELKELFPENHVCYFVSYYDVSIFPMLSSVDKSTKIGLNKTKWTR